MLATGLLGMASLPALAGPEVIPPAPVPPPSDCHGLRGNLSVTLGQTWINEGSGNPISGDDDDEFGSAMVELRLGMDVSDNLYAQFDVIGEFTDVGSNADDSYQRGWGAAFHLMHKTDCCGIGVFGGWFETKQDDNDTDTSERFLVGVEGLFGAGGLDFHWQVGGVIGNGGDDDDGLDSLRDVYFGRLAASKSLGNGWRVGGEVTAAAGVMDQDRDDLELYGWGVHVEKQLSRDWVLALVYQGVYYEQKDEDDDITEHFVGLSATWHFGAGSDVQKCGANLDLPPILRWMGMTGGYLE